MATRETPEFRKQQLLDAGTFVAERTHYKYMSSLEIAKTAGVHHSTIHFYFESMENFRKQVVKQAVKQQNTKIIAQAIVAGDLLVKRAPDRLKRKALKTALEKVS